MSQPVGIHDLVKDMIADRPSVEHWWWCRRHQKAERSNEPTHPVEDCLPTCTMPGEHVRRDCIRVGPFMSEHEAQRLDGANYDYDTSLGMTVEEP